MNPTKWKASLASAAFRLAACLLPFAAASGCSGQTGASPGSAPAAAKAPESGKTGAATKTPAGVANNTVELVIDYGDGAQKRFTDIGWRESMTVLDVLKAAQEHSNGISFSARDSGETAMVTKIDDLTNQKGAPNAKNWIFWINGRMGDESCGIAKVRAGDAILWKFGPYE